MANEDMEQQQLVVSDMESALASVSIYANTVWWPDQPDPYKMANLKLWLEYQNSGSQPAQEQFQQTLRLEDAPLPDPTTWIRVHLPGGQLRTMSSEKINESSNHFKVQTVEELKLLRKTSKESVKNIWLKPEPEQRKKDLSLNANVPEFYPSMIFHHAVPLEAYQPFSSHVYQSELVAYPEPNAELEGQWRQPQIPVFCRPATTNAPEWYGRPGTFPNVVLLQRSQRGQPLRGGLQSTLQVLPPAPPRIGSFFLPPQYPQQQVVLSADFPELPSCREKMAGGGAQALYSSNEMVSAARTLKGLARRASNTSRLAINPLQDSKIPPGDTADLSVQAMSESRRLYRDVLAPKAEEDSQTAIEGRFEELEREALEQYISSEDSEAIIGRNNENDDPYQDLEREAEEQYDDQSEQEIKASLACESVAKAYENLDTDPGLTGVEIHLEDTCTTSDEHAIAIPSPEESLADVPAKGEVPETTLRQTKMYEAPAKRHKRDRSCLEDTNEFGNQNRQDSYPLHKIGKRIKEDISEVSFLSTSESTSFADKDTIKKHNVSSIEEKPSFFLPFPSPPHNEQSRNEEYVFHVGKTMTSEESPGVTAYECEEKQCSPVLCDASASTDIPKRSDETPSPRGRKDRTTVAQIPVTSHKQRRQKNRQAKLALDGPSEHTKAVTPFPAPPEEKNSEYELESKTIENWRQKLSNSSFEPGNKSNKFMKENRKSYRMQNLKPFESAPRDVDTKTLLSRLKIRALNYLKTVDMKLVMEEKQVVRELLYGDDKGKEKIRNRVRISDITQADIFRTYAKEIATLAKLSTEVIYRRIRREVLEMKTIHVVQPSTAEKRKVRNLIKRCLQLKTKAEELMSERKLPKKQFESLKKEVSDILNTIHKTMDVVYNLREMCRDCAEQLESGKSLLADLALGRELAVQDRSRALKEYGSLFLYLTSERPSGLLLDRVMAKLQKPEHMYASHRDLLRNNLLLARYHDNNAFGVVQIRFISALKPGGLSPKDDVWEEKNWSKELLVGNSSFPISLELDGSTDYYCDPDAVREKKIPFYMDEYYYDGETSYEESQTEVESEEVQNDRCSRCVIF